MGTFVWKSFEYGSCCHLFRLVVCGFKFNFHIEKKS
jgi:hypothetical protein